MSTENQNGQYDVQCEDGICTAKLRLAPAGRVYAVPAERGGALAKSLGLGALPADIVQRTGEGVYLGRSFGVVWREIDEQERTIQFIASDETEDRYGDIIRQDGWQLANYKKNPVGLWCHDSNGMCSAHNGMPVARGVRTEIRGAELLWLAQFWPAGQYEFSDLIFDAYRQGFMNAVSVGFIPVEFKYIEEGYGIEFLKQELLEVSFVPVPANPNALVADSFGKFAAAVRAIEVSAAEGGIGGGHRNIAILENPQRKAEEIEESTTRQRPSEQLKTFCDEGRRMAQRFERKVDDIAEQGKTLGAKLDTLAAHLVREDGQCPKGEDCPKGDHDECPEGENCPMYGKAAAFEVRADKDEWTRRRFRRWLADAGLSKKLLHADTDEDCHISRQSEPERLPKAPEGIAFFRNGAEVTAERQPEGKACACHKAVDIDPALEFLRDLYEGAETDEQRIAVQRVINRTAEALAKAEPDILADLAALPETDLLVELAGASIGSADEGLERATNLRNPQSNEVEGSDLLSALSEAPAPPSAAA